MRIKHKKNCDGDDHYFFPPILSLIKKLLLLSSASLHRLRLYSLVQVCLVRHLLLGSRCPYMIIIVIIMEPKDVMVMLIFLFVCESCLDT